MSFFKSYYNSVSSYIVGNEGEDENKEDVIKEIKDDDVKVKESKSDGWLTGIYYDAYNNSGEVWRAVKTDLGEFASVISKDAKTVVVKTANGLKNGLVGDVEDAGSDNSYYSTSKIKAGINRMLEQVSKTLYIPPDSDDDDFYYNSDTGSQTIYSRIDARIARLQSDQNTFSSDPSCSEVDVDLGDFNVWKEKLNMDDFQSTIAELVKQNKSLLDNFTELVPDKVSFELFWARYFYRVASAKAEESRREALKLRISNDEGVQSVNDGGDWDDGNEETGAALLNTVTKEPESVIEQFKEDSQKITREDLLTITEKNDVIMVKHVDSSSASEDNNQPEESADHKEAGDYACWDDDEIDVELTEEDLELARKVTDKEVLESKWEDWG